MEACQPENQVTVLIRYTSRPLASGYVRNYPASYREDACPGSLRAGESVLTAGDISPGMGVSRDQQIAIRINAKS